MAEIKASQDDEKVIHPLSYVEETEFLNYIDQPKYKNWKPLFYFMFGTGCRIGEVIGIRWGDIDFDRNEISINHDITYGPKEKNGFKCDYEVGPPKTKAGIRTIPLMEKVKVTLEEERRQQDELGCHNTSVVDGMSGFVFCNRYGKLHKPSTINRAIYRIDYVPFDSDTIGNPALDIGDVLTFVGGQADENQISAITSNQVKIYGKQTLKGVGKNPRLVQAKSKNDKNISGLLSQIEAGKIEIHTFTNASAFTIHDQDTKIISIEFATSEDNHAQFFGQVIVDIDADEVTRTATATGNVTIPAVNVDAISQGLVDHFLYS